MSNQKNILTIKDLRKRGYRVSVNHYRYLDHEFKNYNLVSYHNIRTEKWQNRINPRGGRTTIELFSKDGDKIHEVVSQCSKKDPFNRHIALKICMDRLVYHMNNKNMNDNCNNSNSILHIH